MHAGPSQTERSSSTVARVLASVSLVFAVVTLALLAIDLSDALANWRFSPLIQVGDDLKAVIATQNRASSSDSFMIGLAARAAAPDSGPATLVVPTDMNDLRDPYVSIQGDEYSWVNLDLLDDLLTSDIVAEDYRSSLPTETADALVARGDLWVFANAVLAPPIGSVPTGETLALYSIGNGHHFALIDPDLAEQAKGESDAR